VGSTVVALRPISQNTGRPSFRHFGTGGPPHTTEQADIIPFEPRHLSKQRQPAAPTPPTTGNYLSDSRDAAMGEDDYRHRMFENLATAAWVGVLMISAYYLFGELLRIS